MVTPDLVHTVVKCAQLKIIQRDVLHEVTSLAGRVLYDVNCIFSLSKQRI